MSKVELIKVRAGEFEPLSEMVAALNAEDGHPVGEASRAALRVLLDTPAYGQAFWIADPQISAPERIGYCIVCFGYSIELGGRDMLIDELYIQPGFRGRGYGGQTLHAIEDYARALDFASIFLEVMRGNRAEALYRKMGYEDRDSVFLGKLLMTADPDGPSA